MNWSLYSRSLKKYQPKQNKRLVAVVRASFVGQLIGAALLIILLDLFGSNIIRADNEAVIFEDVSSEAGFRTVESNSGAAWVDYDNDGREDLYVGHHAAVPTMHRNNGQGGFTEVQVGLTYDSDHHGFSWADHDNDGWTDLYITTGRATGGSLFFVNDNGVFNEQAGQAKILNYRGRGRLARWADYDNDGYLDLFVGNAASRSHGTEDDKLFHNRGDGTFSDVTQRSNLVDDDVHTEGFGWGDYNGDGLVDLLLAGSSRGSLALYRNKGDGTFTNVTEMARLATVNQAKGTAWGDYDNDGDLDFYVARGEEGFGDKVELVNANKKIKFINNSGGDRDGFSFLHSGDQITVSIWFAGYAAQTKWIFIGSAGYHPPTTTSFVLDDNDPRNWGKPSYTPGQSRGAFIWKTADGWRVDLSRDRFTGIVASNGSISQMSLIDVEPYVSSSTKENLLYRNNGDGTFTDVIDASGIGDDPVMTTNSAAWVDFDNDGDLDLYEVNQGDVDSGTQPNRLYRNDGHGVFTNVAQEVHLEARDANYSLCGAWADYDQDGFLDLFLTSNWWAGLLAGPEKLYHNQGNDNHWLRLKLVGTQSNRSGIGARVEIQTASGLQYRDTSISAGSPCQDSSIVHFGLGPLNTVDRLKITWPSGVVDVFDTVAANQVVTIQEGSAASPSLDAGQTISADPAAFVTFTHTVTNTGALEDSFEATASSALPNWPVAVSPSRLGPLGLNESAAFSVTVQLPAGVPADTQNSINVTVRSQTNSLAEAMKVTDIVTVNPVYNVILTGAQSVYARPGEQAVFRHDLTNTGNAPDSFTLEVTSRSPHCSIISPLEIGPVAPQETVPLTITAAISPDAVTGNQETVIVTARSQAAPAVEATMIDTVVIGEISRPIYLPLVLSN